LLERTISLDMSALARLAIGAADRWGMGAAAGGAIDADSDMGQSYVVDAHATFRASARFDDLLDLRVFLVRLGRSSYAIRVDITRAGQTLVEVDLTYVRAVDGVSMPLSEGFRTILADMETTVQQIVSPVP
jgi:acyl-CoA hydrolase